MTFEEWMAHCGLSNSSIDKYAGAIRGAISDWAMQAELIDAPLTSLVSQTEFEKIDAAIRELTIYKERNDRGHNMYHSALLKFGEYLKEGHSGDIEFDIDSILDTKDIDETEKRNLLKSRIGQGIFRQDLISYWKACSVTGFNNISLLVASHIKPWKSSNSMERLDPFNGLLLVPNLDKAFDAGFVTFETSGDICISSQLTTPEHLGIHNQMSVMLDDKHQPYMKYHREHVYRDT